MSGLKAEMKEKPVLVTGRLEVFTGKVLRAEYNNAGELIEYEFDREKKLLEGQNVICNGFWNAAVNLNATPCVIAIGNGDNGTVNGTGGLVDPVNAPDRTNVSLNNELENGRFPCVKIRERFNTETGIATFNSPIPAANQAATNTVTEWGLFGGVLGSLALNSTGAGYLMARRAEVFTKNPNDDVDVVWTITFSIG